MHAIFPVTLAEDDEPTLRIEVFGKGDFALHWEGDENSHFDLSPENLDHIIEACRDAKRLMLGDAKPRRKKDEAGGGPDGH